MFVSLGRSPVVIAQLPIDAPQNYRSERRKTARTHFRRFLTCVVSMVQSVDRATVVVWGSGPSAGAEVMITWLKSISLQLDVASLKN